MPATTTRRAKRIPTLSAAPASRVAASGSTSWQRCARARPDDPPSVCQFSEYPGTVGWKTGFRFLRDEVLSGPAVPPDADDPCDQPGSSCVRRFDRSRNEIFHYALFGHAIGLPKSDMPCLDDSGTPVPANSATDRCDAPLTSNPEFHAPRTNTGIADFPGGDILVTLGAFADTDGKPVGTPFMQAGTFMHEWGHNAELTHGGRRRRSELQADLRQRDELPLSAARAARRRGPAAPGFFARRLCARARRIQSHRWRRPCRTGSAGSRRSSTAISQARHRGGEAL